MNYNTLLNYLQNRIFIINQDILKKIFYIKHNFLNKSIYKHDGSI